MTNSGRIVKDKAYLGNRRIVKKKIPSTKKQCIRKSHEGKSQKRSISLRWLGCNLLSQKDGQDRT